MRQVLACVPILALSTGCIVVDDRHNRHYQSDYAYDVSDDVVFEYSRNISDMCATRSDTWRIVARDLGQEASASCAEEIVFRNVSAGTSVIYDIEAYQGSTLCAQGSCMVTSERGTNLADCSREIEYYCRY